VSVAPDIGHKIKISAEMVEDLGNVVPIQGSLSEESLFNSPAELQQTALDSLPSYPVRVVRRNSHKDPVRTSHGTFYQETARYSDGAVRLTTIGVPHQVRIPNAVVSGDPWFTGPNGFNRVEIEQLVNDGFVVVWNHHQGRHSVAPTSREHIRTIARFLTSKSLAKSASQDHALLDKLGETAGFDTDNIIRRGYSRSAMSGEAFIAQAALPSIGREVVWSDLEGACFARKVGHLAMAKGVSKQLPHEVQAVLDIKRQLAVAVQEDADHRIANLEELKGTLDFHPLNMLHELAWQRLLITGDAGRYAQAIPLHARGVRTAYKHDFSGQQLDWRRIHAPRQGISIIEEDGGHLSGAEPRMLHKKRMRMLRLRDYYEEHGFSFTGLTYQDILPPEIEKA
jgi:hypothetical protein